MQFLNALKTNLKSRPHWMNALMLFCAYMTFIYLPWDIFIKPLAEDQEVWFGLLFTGWSAKAGAVLHWYVYAAGFWGFWKMRSWMFPWASLYAIQVAIGMFIWSLLDERGGGIVTGLISAIPFLALATVLWKTSHFRSIEKLTDEPETK